MKKLFTLALAVVFIAAVAAVVSLGGFALTKKKH